MENGSNKRRKMRKSSRNIVLTTLLVSALAFSGEACKKKQPNLPMADGTNTVSSTNGVYVAGNVPQTQVSRGSHTSSGSSWWLWGYLSGRSSSSHHDYSSPSSKPYSSSPTYPSSHRSSSSGRDSGSGYSGRSSSGYSGGSSHSSSKPTASSSHVSRGGFGHSGSHSAS